MPSEATASWAALRALVAWWTAVGANLAWATSLVRGGATADMMLRLDRLILIVISRSSTLLGY